MSVQTPADLVVGLIVEEALATVGRILEQDGDPTERLALIGYEAKAALARAAYVGEHNQRT